MQRGETTTSTPGTSATTAAVTETRSEGGWGTFNVPPFSPSPREIHIAPLFGPQHQLDIGCWCRPDRSPDDQRLVVHNVSH